MIPNADSEYRTPAKLETRYTFWFVFIVLALVLNALATYRSLDALLESRSLVAHSYTVLLSTEGIVQSADQIVMSERAYLLAKDEATLKPYHDACKAIRAEIERLAGLTIDNPVQQANLKELRAAVEDEIQAVDQGIEGFRASGLETIAPAMQQGFMENKHRAIREVMSKFTAEESRLLQSRRSATAHNWQTMIVTVTVLFSGLLILLGVVFHFLRRDLRARRANLLMLERRVRERTVQLESANRELEAFAYSVSHDLRAPLRSISGFSEALSEDYGDRLEGEARDYLSRIVAASRRMGDLIDDLLNLSRVTRSEIVKKPVDLSAAAESVAQEVRKRASGAREVSLKIEAGLHAVGDPRLLQIALNNLLDNAFKYSAKAEKPAVEFLRHSDAETEATFVVRDNGVGFDMQYVGKLFAPFQRLHRAEDFSGTGIGLAIVQRIIARHGGSVRAEGRIGEGAAFYFTLPKERN